MHQWCRLGTQEALKQECEQNQTMYEVVRDDVLQTQESDMNKMGLNR